MNYIDTHCHLYMDNYKNDRSEIIQRAIDNGVKKMICIGVDLSTSEKSLYLAEKYSEVFATAGIHPHEANKVPTNYQHELEQFYKHPKVVAVGEIGLDFHYNYSDKNEQIQIFNEQLELAKSESLPAVVHSRKSDHEILDSLNETNNNYGVIHCFAGSLEFSEQIIKIGYHLSFTGLITFVNELEKVVKNTPLNKMMLETDSPYLTPIPNRGKRNEPIFIKHIAEKVSTIKEKSIDEIVSQTNKTVEKFFKKLK